MVSVDQLSLDDNFDQDDLDSTTLNSNDGESKSNITGKASRFFRKVSNSST